MNKPHDDEALSDINDEHSSIESLSVEHIIPTAAFPIYGLIDHPEGLTLKGIGYCTVSPEMNQTNVAGTSTRPRILWEVSLRFERPSVLQRYGQGIQSIDVYSWNIHQSPVPAPPIEHPDGANEIRYSSPGAVVEEGAQERAFVIERFPIIDGIVVAGVRFFAHPPLPGRLLGTQVHHSPHPVSPPPAPDGPEWSFTLRGPEIWLGGSARGWDQSKLFAVLGRLAAVNHRAEVVSQYERELLDWKCA